MPVEQPVPPPAAVTSVTYAAILSRGVYAVVALGIPDLLAAGPRRSTDLAAAVDVQPRQLHQVLRAVATTGLLRTDGSPAPDRGCRGQRHSGGPVGNRGRGRRRHRLPRRPGRLLCHWHHAGDRRRQLDYRGEKRRLIPSDTFGDLRRPPR